MAKANLVLPNGTTVAIEGTADEVAVLLSKFSQPAEVEPSKTQKRKKPRLSGGTVGGTKKKKDGPTGLITELAKEGYFKSKRTISDIQKKLEELGHIYAITSISPCLTRLTKSRTLRRLKENKVWVYVN
jgi:hypothetical protein